MLNENFNKHALQMDTNFQCLINEYFLYFIRIQFIYRQNFDVNKLVFYFTSVAEVTQFQNYVLLWTWFIYHSTARHSQLHSVIDVVYFLSASSWRWNEIQLRLNYNNSSEPKTKAQIKIECWNIIIYKYESFRIRDI